MPSRIRQLQAYWDHELHTPTCSMAAQDPVPGGGHPMMRLTQAPNAAIAQIWADLLCEAGYPATIERLHLTSIAGEIPPDQCLPEIWLRHAEHEAAARQLLDDLAKLPQRRWHCLRCGELVEGGFEQCWNCGAWMSESVDEDGQPLNASGWAPR